MKTEKKSAKGLSRRDFMKGAALVTGAGILAGCAPKVAETAAPASTSAAAGAEGTAVPSASGFEHDQNGITLLQNWLGTAPEFDSYDEEIEVDVIVCGGGVAGVSAARAAVEEGATVALFEKCAGLQCRSGDYGVIGSKIFEEHWGRDNTQYRQDIINELVKSSGNRANTRIIQKFVDNVGDAFDWYAGSKEDLYILSETTEIPPENVTEWLQPARYPSPADFDMSKEWYKCYQVTAQFYPDQSTVFQAHYEKANATGLLQTFLSTPVKKLLREEGGRVTGIVAQDADGKIIHASAKKGVVLATGDYSANTDMLLYYTPWVKNNFHFFTSMDADGNFTDTGDGHRMAMWIGAKMEEGPHATNNHNMGGTLGSTAFLELDIHGERFQNEDCPGQELDNLLNRMPGRTLYQVFDANWVNEVPFMTPGHGMVSAIVSEEAAARNSYLSPIYGYANQAMVDAAVEAGTLMTSDTIEGLVDQFEITDDAKTTAVASIKRYGELANKGVDEDYGKLATRLSKLETPPYYAAKFGMAGLLVTHGGLENDHELRVLDNDRNVIPGLYVCGNTQSGKYAVHYPITVPGSSHASALTFGRLAGINAAKAV